MKIEKCLILSGLYVKVCVCVCVCVSVVMFVHWWVQSVKSHYRAALGTKFPIFFHFRL
jgi:uncharacterized ion transporter superfamily protein YfcC